VSAPNGVSSSTKVRIAVAGGGLIGKRHLEEIHRSDVVEVAAVVDPGPAGPELAQKYGVPLFLNLTELFAADKPDGVILATPNQLHVDGGLQWVAAMVPVIVEKPIGDSVDAATRLVEAGEAAGVPILTGHHRNYSPITLKARELVNSGALGQLVAVIGTALFYKPDVYFDDNGGWRKRPGGGPLMLNLIHEVNNLLMLVGDITEVHAKTSNATRGFAVEDTAAMIFSFANGAVGTFVVSDAAASPRSWEMTSSESSTDKSFDHYDDEDAYHLAGTRGSLSIPTMRLKTYPEPASWWEKFDSSTLDVDKTDPIANQIKHFAEVIRGEAKPICTGRDGLKALMVVEAVVESSRTGQPVAVSY
jgi:predicted dehydrogenase